MTLTVNVTAEDIAQGRRSDCHLCPVARALRRVTGSVWAAVGRYEMVWRGPNAKAIRCDTPDEVIRFVADFDSVPGVNIPPFAPFSFELEIPEATT